jgi:group I intron endonuclease
MYIYKITNLINGKIYIGQTTEDNPEYRIKSHFKKTRSKDLVRDAAKKYGRDSLKHELIYFAFDLGELNRAEKFFIQEYKSLVPNGYNIQLGGNGKGRWSEESKKQNGSRVKEWYKSNEHPFKGKKFSQDHVTSLSKARKGFDSPARQKARLTCHKESRKPLISINIKTNEFMKHDSIGACAKTLNLQSSCISRVVSGKQNRIQHNGYTFKYVDKDSTEEV